MSKKVCAQVCSGLIASPIRDGGLASPDLLSPLASTLRGACELPGWHPEGQLIGAFKPHLMRRGSKNACSQVLSFPAVTHILRRQPERDDAQGTDRLVENVLCVYVRDVFSGEGC